MQMGRQILFYMVDEDEDEFLEFVRSSFDVVILPQTSEIGRGEEFSSFRELAGRKLGEACHLWNRSLSPEPLIKHIPQQGYFWLDFMQSEVVNVMRSKRLDQRLSMGRLHIENKARRPDGGVVEKSGEFVNWFNELCRWIKKTYPSTFDGACLSSRAEALAKSGVELTGHSF